MMSIFFATGLLFAEGGAEFSGDIETLWGVGAPWTDEDVAAGKFTLADTTFTGKLDAYYNNSSAYAEATFAYDAAGALNGEGGSGNSGLEKRFDKELSGEDGMSSIQKIGGNLNLNICLI